MHVWYLLACRWSDPNVLNQTNYTTIDAGLDSFAQLHHYQWCKVILFAVVWLTNQCCRRDILNASVS